MTELMRVHEKAMQPITYPLTDNQKPAWSPMLLMLVIIAIYVAFKKFPIARFSWGIGNAV